MKKSIIAAIAAVIGVAGAISFTSCGSGQAGAAANDTTITQSTADSLSLGYGNLMGAYFNKNILDAERYDSLVVNRPDFIKGLQLVLSQDYSEDFMAGVMAGAQIQSDLKKYGAQGVNMDRRVILEQVRRLVLADSVSQADSKRYQDEMTAIQNRVNALIERREELRVRQSPQAVANDNAGKAVSQKAVKQGAVETESGLVALIAERGTDSISEDQRLMVNIAIRHADGRVIRQGSAVEIMPRGQYPGIQEGLKMIGMGGKGTFYLPPQLGTGINGVPEMEIGPMEWLVVDIEVLGETVS